MAHIGIITGSTRPGRKSLDVANWVHDLAVARNDGNTYEVIDLAEFSLPIWASNTSPRFEEERPDHVKPWANAIAGQDGFVFVTPEYNHAAPAVLLNALTFLAQEWNNKAAGFVSYGSAGGVRAVENLRVVLAELSVATTRSAPAMSIFEDWKNFSEFAPRTELHAPLINSLLSEVSEWAEALKSVRLAAVASV